MISGTISDFVFTTDANGTMRIRNQKGRVQYDSKPWYAFFRARRSTARPPRTHGEPHRARLLSSRALHDGRARCSDVLLFCAP